MTQLGYKHTAEHNQRIKDNHKGMLGKKLSQETIKKLRLIRAGSGNARWKGGKSINYQGYIMINSPNHPNKDKRNCIPEHRLVMEKHLGRTLLPTEVVHHINGDKKDNRIQNLMIFSSNGEHIKFHAKSLY